MLVNRQKKMNSNAFHIFIQGSHTMINLKFSRFSRLNGLKIKDLKWGHISQVKARIHYVTYCVLLQCQTQQCKKAYFAFILAI